MSTRTNEAGETARYLYDPRSNLARVEELGPRGATLVTQYFYDARGNLERQIDPRGAETTFQYDPAGRLEAEISDSLAVYYDYDETGNLKSVTDGRGTTFHQYDLLGRLIEARYPTGEVETFTYDPTGRRLTITYEGRTYWYVYDGHGDVAGLVDAAGAMVARYEYDDYGRVVHMWGAGGREAREGQAEVH